MRLKILIVICVILAVGWFIGMAWIISGQSVQIRELQGRLNSVEVIVYREVVSTNTPKAPKYTHPEMAI